MESLDSNLESKTLAYVKYLDCVNHHFQQLTATTLKTRLGILQKLKNSEALKEAHSLQKNCFECQRTYFFVIWHISRMINITSNWIIQIVGIMSATIPKKYLFDCFRVQHFHTHFEKAERRANETFQIWHIRLTTITTQKESYWEAWYNLNKDSSSTPQHQGLLPKTN